MNSAIVKMLTILILFVLYSAVVCGEKCPDHCKCSNVMGKNLTICQESGYKNVPKVFNETNFFDLSGNSIHELGNYTLASAGLRNAETIILDSTGLMIVDRNAFRGLRWLKELDLSNNSISKLNQYTFADNKILEFLNLSRNPIVELEAYQFTALPNLKTLDFSDCKLREINYEAFSNLMFLENLILRNNQLSTLPNGVFTWMRNLNAIDLHDNPWHCDCDLQNLVIMLLIRRIYTKDLFCHYETDGGASLWHEMQSVHADCIPYIENNIKESIITVGNKYDKLHEMHVHRSATQSLYSSRQGSMLVPILMVSAIVIFMVFLCFIYRKSKRPRCEEKIESDESDGKCNEMDFSDIDLL